ncbi:MAG: dihydroorotate dehydrogenase-like protein [Acidimicrobiales bacterium]|nr:dihydroorotate dehydrogenase-like protein [Acidimicrobiales bacterium]
MSTVDLRTSYLGLDLAHPVMASASPLTGHVETLVQLAEAGAAAVVLPSLFEEQIEHETMEVHHGLEYGAEQFAEASDGYFPELDDYNTGPDHYLETLRAAKQAVDIPVIASLNGTTTGGWTYYAKVLEDAGADALELNIYLVAADIHATAVEIEDQYLSLVERVRSSVDVPLAVKIGPYFSAPANMARRLVEAGADGLVLFNRFYQPDLDLDELAVVPDIVLSSPAEMRLVLRWMALLHGRIDASLAATTGVHSWSDVVKLLLAGADVTMMASALLLHGPQHVTDVVAGMTRWFTERGYESVNQARGSLSQEASPDPTAFERANYMKTLISYS